MVGQDYRCVLTFDSSDDARLVYDLVFRNVCQSRDQGNGGLRLEGDKLTMPMSVMRRSDEYLDWARKVKLDIQDR